MNVDIIYQDVEFDVEFDYQPYEKPEYYHSDGLGYPGCEASISGISIYYGRRDMTEYFDDELDEIEELIWEELSSTYDPEP